MEQHWITRNGNGKLIVFVLGWAADHEVVAHIAPDGYDVLSIYDYRTMEPAGIAPESYSESYLFAWSFGVWVAEQLFAHSVFTRAVAFNGTPFPVSGDFGIAPRRLDTTIRGLRSGGMEAFERRTYGRWYDALEEKLSPRTLEQNIEELIALRDLSSVPYNPRIEWNKAITGSEDVIFPSAAMQNYWSVRAQTLPLPHYPFADAEIILNEIENR